MSKIIHWIQTKCGVVNIVSFVIVVPILIWIGIREYSSSVNEEKLQQDFQVFVQEYRDAQASNVIPFAKLETYQQMNDLLVQTLEKMNQNIYKNNELLRNQPSNPITINIPQTIPQKRSRPRRTQPCPRFVMSARTEKVGENVIIIEELIPNPNLQKCLQSHRKK